MIGIESLGILISSALPAASYIYKNSHTRNSLPSPSLAFQTTPSTLQQISSFNLFARFNYLQTFPKSSIPNFPDTSACFVIIKV